MDLALGRYGSFALLIHRVIFRVRGGIFRRRDQLGKEAVARRRIEAAVAQADLKQPLVIGGPVGPGIPTGKPDAAFRKVGREVTSSLDTLMVVCFGTTSPQSPGK